MTDDASVFLADLGLRVRVLRIAARMPQDQLGKAARISRVTLDSIERGHHAAGILTYRALAAALGVPLASLFDEESRLGYLTRRAQPPRVPDRQRRPAAYPQQPAGIPSPDLDQCDTRKADNVEASMSADSADYGAYPEDEGQVPVEELARRQGVRPIKSVDELARDGIFESDEELEEFLAEIRAMRGASLSP
jgi:transcriptional regulator with XRE-family HTH domain